MDRNIYNIITRPSRLFGIWRLAEMLIRHPIRHIHFSSKLFPKNFSNSSFFSYLCTVIRKYRYLRIQSYNNKHESN